MAATGEPRVQRRCVARCQRSPQHDLGDPVDLDEDDARHVGRGGVLTSAARTSGHVIVEPGVVVDRHQMRHDGGDDRQADRDHDGGPEALDLGTRREVEHDADDDGVDGDRPDPEREDRERDHEERQGGPHRRVEQADQGPGDQCSSDVVELEAVEQGGEQPERDRVGDHDDEAASDRLPPARTELLVSQQGRAVLGHRTPEFYDSRGGPWAQSP